MPTVYSSVWPGQGTNAVLANDKNIDRAAIPELACGVLSRAAGPGLVPAVRSLLEQSEPVEIVVVNSDGGDPVGVLRAAGIDVPVVHFHQRLFPGAVRNIAVEATRAPYVAFLAADCRAEPGWAAGRLREHRRGASAVACVMSSATPANRCSNAALLLQHNRRLPDTPPRERLLYGLSYSRDLLERLGGFPEDLRAGEDTKLNERLDADPVWAPDVRCAHSYPTTLPALVHDLYARGRRRAAMRRIEGEPFSWQLARSALRNVDRCAEQAELTSDPVKRARMLAARRLLRIGALASATGVALQRWRVFQRPDREYRLDPAPPRPAPDVTPQIPVAAPASGASGPARR
jgi:Glycosyl transferase family 2